MPLATPMTAGNAVDTGVTPDYVPQVTSHLIWLEQRQ